MGVLIRALPPFFQAAPYAIGAALMVGAIGWLVMRERHRQGQFAATGLAFGCGLAFGMYQLITGLAFQMFGGSGADAADKADVVGWSAAVLIVVVSAAVGALTQRRLFLVGVLPAVGYGLVLILFTLPIVMMRG